MKARNSIRKLLIAAISVFVLMSCSSKLSTEKKHQINAEIDQLIQTVSNAHYTGSMGSIETIMNGINDTWVDMFTIILGKKPENLLGGNDVPKEWLKLFFYRLEIIKSVNETESMQNAEKWEEMQTRLISLIEPLKKYIDSDRAEQSSLLPNL